MAKAINKSRPRLFSDEDEGVSNWRIISIRPMAEQYNWGQH